MKEILTMLIDSIKTEYFTLGLVCIIASVVINLKSILRFFDNRKKAKIANLKSALQCEYLTGTTKEHLKHKLAAEHYKMATGIYIEELRREYVIKAYLDAKGELLFSDLKRSLPYINVTAETAISVRFCFSDWIGFIFNLIFGVFIALFGAVVFTFPIVSKSNSPFALVYFILGIIITIFGIITLSFFLQYLTAMKVKKILDKKSKGNKEKTE